MLRYFFKSENIIKWKLLFSCIQHKSSQMLWGLLFKLIDVGLKKQLANYFCSIHVEDYMQSQNFQLTKKGKREYKMETGMDKRK